MSKRTIHCWLLVWLLLYTEAVAEARHNRKEPSDPVEPGRQLFNCQFVAGERQRHGGDGLGPVFNHVSCAACHRQGALGGGGGVEFNVTLLCAQLADPSRHPKEEALR